MEKVILFHFPGDTEGSAGIPTSVRLALQNLGHRIQPLGDTAGLGDRVLGPEESISPHPRSDCFPSHYLSELKLEAVTITSSLLCTSTGIFRQPGDFSRRCSSFRVS